MSRDERAEKRYAKTLAGYLKRSPEGPGADEARAWLAAREAAGL